MRLWKYRIIKKESEELYRVQIQPAIWFGFIYSWDTIFSFISLPEAQKYCLDCIQEDKLKNKKPKILQVYKP